MCGQPLQVPAPDWTEKVGNYDIRRSSHKWGKFLLLEVPSCKVDVKRSSAKGERFSYSMKFSTYCESDHLLAVGWQCDHQQPIQSWQDCKGLFSFLPKSGDCKEREIWPEAKTLVSERMEEYCIDVVIELEAGAELCGKYRVCKQGKQANTNWKEMQHIAAAASADAVLHPIVILGGGNHAGSSLTLDIVTCVEGYSPIGVTRMGDNAVLLAVRKEELDAAFAIWSHTKFEPCRQDVDASSQSNLVHLVAKATPGEVKNNFLKQILEQSPELQSKKNMMGCLPLHYARDEPTVELLLLGQDLEKIAHASDRNREKPWLPVLRFTGRLFRELLTDKVRTMETLDLSCEEGATELKSVVGLEQCPELKTVNLGGCTQLESVAGLEQCTRLTTVNLSRCEKLESLVGLEQCTRLTTVNLSRCEKLESLVGLEQCTRLKTITLSRCEKLGSLAELKCTKLEDLNLSGCTELQRLVGLEQCPELKTVTLSHCTELESLAELKCTKLKNLYLSGCPELKTVVGLKRFPELKTVTLSGCEKLESLAELKCTKLEDLYLSGCTGLQSVIGLEHCAELKTVSLSGCEKLESLAELKCTKLEDLYLSGCTGLQSVIGLEHCAELKTVSLSGCEKLESLAELKCTKLEDLNLNGCTGLKRVAGLEQCAALKTVHLRGCEKLESLAELKCTKLENLYLNGCTGLQSVVGLDQCAALETVNLSGCEKLESLAELNCTKLHDLDLSGCTGLQSVVGLEHCAELKRVNLNRCEKLDSVAGLENCPKLEDLNLEGCTCIHSQVQAEFHDKLQEQAANAKAQKLQGEEQLNKQQQAMGGPVLRRLRGPPGALQHDLKERTVSSVEGYATIGAPDPIQSAGVLYYEVVIGANSCHQIEFSHQLGFACNAFPELDAVTQSGVGDANDSWGVSSSSVWHDGDIIGCARSLLNGVVLGLAVNVDLGKFAVSEDGDWTKENCGVIIEDSKIKDGVYPCMTITSRKWLVVSDLVVQYNLGASRGQFLHGPPLESVWRGEPKVHKKDDKWQMVSV